MLNTAQSFLNFYHFCYYCDLFFYQLSFFLQHFFCFTYDRINNRNKLNFAYYFLFKCVFFKCYISYNHLLTCFVLCFFLCCFSQYALVCFCCILLVLRILVSVCVLHILFVFPFSSLILSLLLDIHIKVFFFVFFYAFFIKFPTLILLLLFHNTQLHYFLCRVASNSTFFLFLFCCFFLLHNTLQLPERGAGVYFNIYFFCII